MPTINTIKEEIQEQVKTSSELELESLVNQHDATLKNLEHSIMQGFKQLWGKPGEVRDKDELIEILNLDPAKTLKIFQGHSAFATTLENSGLVVFEDWEKTTPYPVSFTESGIELGEDLNESWVVEEPEEPVEENPE